MRKLKILFILLFICSTLFADEVFEERYQAKSSQKYTSVKNSTIFEYTFSSDLPKEEIPNLAEICSEYFPSYELIGTSYIYNNSQISIYYNSTTYKDLLKFAKKKGADIVVIKTCTIKINTQDKSSIVSKTDDNNGNSATTVSTLTTEKWSNTYEAAFLRNVNSEEIFWLKNKSDFKCTPSKDFPGFWVDSLYGNTMEVYETYDGFIFGALVEIGDKFKDKSIFPKWKKGDLFFIVSKDTGEGFYFDYDKTPWRAALSKEALEQTDALGFTQKNLNLKYKITKDTGKEKLTRFTQ